MSHFIPEPRNFAEVTRLPADVKKAWLKATLKYIENLIDNQTFTMDDPEKGYPETPCMYVYKKNIKSYVSIYKLKLRILVTGEFKNKEMIGENWDQKSSTRTLNYFLSYAAKHE